MSEELRSRVVEAFYWRRLHATATVRENRRRAAVNRLTDSRTILFLCHGNVCRSPFAERYARNQLAARGIDTLDVRSAGSAELCDPRSPLTARRTAEQYDVDLTDHRATSETAREVDEADLLLVMDYRNYHHYLNQYPEATGKLFLLRIFDGGNEIQVPDPHGYGNSVFESVYADIAASVTSLLDEYETVVTADESVERTHLDPRSIVD
ncbi:low molecular weight protein-tyrosine-phosphatase [Halobellus captivus]|uniref:low molecular weight protein-tyrosine-phosphatase n=1 Tax=Halobellus captivus TaxID=2592614 RepID=UPI001396B0CA|nr:low molecular weight protein-tyrosine-phosphatase [Halobellus captivus]